MLVLPNRLHLLAACAIGMITFHSPSFASSVTTADITVQNLSITAENGAFVLRSDNGVVTATAGPDSFMNFKSQASSISGPTSATATISTATAQATSAIPFIDTASSLISSISLDGTVGASSGVNLGSIDAISQSNAVAKPKFEFQLPNANATNPITLTFSMTVHGILSGIADSLGSYTGEIMAQFGYYSDATPFAFIPVVSFDQSLSGGPSDDQIEILDPVTLTASVTFNTSQDYLFQTLAEAQSRGTDRAITTAVPEPSTLALIVFGFASVGALARRNNENCFAPERCN